LFCFWIGQTKRNRDTHKIRAGCEIYGFERLKALFSTGPNAREALEAAVDFDQDDDNSVLTLTRVATDEESTAVAVHPIPIEV